MGKKDYTIKGIEGHGRPERIKVLNKEKDIKDLGEDEKQFVEFVK